MIINKHTFSDTLQLEAATEWLVHLSELTNETFVHLLCKMNYIINLDY